MLRGVLVITAVLSAFPVGYLLAWLCRDELVQGRKWFKLIAVVSVIIILILLFAYRELAVILTLIYICFISLISLYKSYDFKN